MTALTIACLLPCMALSACSRRDENETAIETRMLRLAGPQAEQCGVIRHGMDHGDGWDCVQRAEREGRSFWMAMQARPTDAAVWHVAVRNNAAERFIVFYSSNRFGQSAFEPHFDIQPCNEPFVLAGTPKLPLTCGTTPP
ncbi:hypothetical protein [Lysobacter panacisoli]|nr:hypothetical protein [Lysobacter panacisoli]